MDQGKGKTLRLKGQGRKQIFPADACNLAAAGATTRLTWQPLCIASGTPAGPC